MTNAIWTRVRRGSPGTRIFAAYVALVLVVAMVGPGLAVYAAEGGSKGVGEVVEAPADLPPAAAEPVLENVVENAAGPKANEVVEPEPEMTGGSGQTSQPEAGPASSGELPAAEPPLMTESGTEPELSFEAAVLSVPMMLLSVGNPVLSPISNPALGAGGVRIGNPADGTYDAGTVEKIVGPVPADFWITIDTYETSEGWFFDFESNYPITRIVVKGGSAGANIYTYDPGVMSGTGLHAPANPNGKYAGLSHLDFYFGQIVAPEYGDLIVYKYEDLNQNETYDDGEPLLEDWEFTLYDGEDAELDSGLTDADGELFFGTLVPGDYSVTETLTDGWVNTTALTQSAVIVAGETAELWFGNIREVQPPETGDLLIHKYEDANENSKYDEGETMLEDWEFTVTQETPPVGVEEFGALAAQLVGSGLTDANGELGFPGLAPGEYHVTETLQDGWTNTTPLTQVVGVVAGQTAEVWFGNVEESLPFTELDLAILKVADRETASEGGLITYTLTYWNLGELAAENFTIVDDYDQRYVTVVTAAGGTVAGGKITWTFPGPLAKADGPRTLIYTVRVIADMPVGTTNVDNVVVIDHPRDMNKTNNVANERVVVRVAAEPFLPFTGGEYSMLIGLAVVATALGLLLRLRRVVAS